MQRIFFLFFRSCLDLDVLYIGNIETKIHVFICTIISLVSVEIKFLNFASKRIWASALAPSGLREIKILVNVSLSIIFWFLHSFGTSLGSVDEFSHCVFCGR